MPAFRFEALDANGKTVNGLVDADNPKAARAQLRAQALVPLQVDAVVGVYTDQAQRITTQAGYVHGAGHTVVGFDRGVGHQPVALQPGPPHVGA